MSVSSAMYAAISGLQTTGTAMSVVSNNIANSNTVGFKAGRAEFVDMLSQRVPTAAGSSQVGRGVRMGAINQVFSQGAFKTSSQDTDIAIGGEGFFKVRDPQENAIYYTRAGNFIFDEEGRLTMPTGHILQGWALDDNGDIINSTQDIMVIDTTAEPQVTSRAQFAVNLDSEAESKTDGVPLSNRWDGTEVTDPIDATAYSYQTSLDVYDPLGGKHSVTIYFDKDDTIDNKWDYLVCCDPEEDMRTFDGLPAADDGSNTFQGTRFAGLLQRGTITFEPTDPITGNGGQIREITADTLISDDNDPTIRPEADNTTVSAIAGGTTPPGPTATTVTTVTVGPGTYSGNVDKVFTIRVDDNQNEATATIAEKRTYTSSGVGATIDTSVTTYNGTSDQNYLVRFTGIGGTPATTQMDNATFDLEYSLDNGTTWNAAGSYAGVDLTTTTLPIADGIVLQMTGSGTDLIENDQRISINAQIADLEGQPYPSYTWTDNYGNTGTGLLDNGLGPYSVAEGVEFSLDDIVGSPRREVMYGASFSIDATANWVSADTNTNGYFTVDAAFLRDPGPTPTPNPAVGTPIYQTMEIDLGANNVNYNPGNNTSPWQLEDMSTTQYSATSSTMFQTQDGYASGSLQRITFDADGTLNITYSNGRIAQPYRVALSMFPNQWGLDKLGNNLYTTTQRSGLGTDREPGTNGAGEISPNALEQSNVDLADEFVEMIVQQRGFQANSKIITTTDSMLAELINLKR